MDPPVANDSTHLVLFYYGDAGTPIYSLDSRGSRLESATHWADNSVVSRAFVSTEPGQRGLLLEKVTVRDQGHYRCRVDFLESPTRNSRIKLTVVVPPTKLQITSNLDPGHDLRGIVGPYTLGTEVVYTCKVTGGSPRPKVSWWEGDVLLDNISEGTSGRVTNNEMYQPPLTRHDFNKTLTCRASNSDLMKPLKSSISIDMTYPPTSVLVEGGSNEVTLREGVAKRIICEVKGSRPPAKVIWRMNDRRLNDMDGDVDEVVLRSGVTRSVFTYIPEVNDDGQVLGCSAYNPSMPRVVLRNTTKLAVLYKPRMELRPDSDLQITDLQEGRDVTLRCLVDANPAVTGVQWAHNGVPIQTMSGGHSVKVTQGTLTLRRINRVTSGNYTCAAANTEGATTSNSLPLDVKFPPVCAPGQQLVIGAARQEKLHVPCQVSAYPPPTSFRWAANTSAGLSDIKKGHFTKSGDRSVLKYTARNMLDFGDLLCWATNDVATQKTPCVFRVVPASKPEAVTECSAERNSSMPASYVVMSCKEGWGGGLNQSFTLEVRQRATEEVLEKFSLAVKPSFAISGLKLGVPYLLTITAANARGSSPPVTISYTPPKLSADKVISTPKDETSVSITPILLIFLGVFLGIVACVGVGVFLRKKGSFRRHSIQLKMGYTTSLKDLREGHDLPTIVCLNKENSSGTGSPLSSLYVNPTKILNNQSLASLDNENIYVKDTLSIRRAPLARADSLDDYSICSSRMPSAASSMIKMPFYSRPPSRQASFKSHTSIALNPENLLKKEYLRRDSYVTKSNYMTDDRYFQPVNPNLLAHHHLAKSDNLLKENYIKNEIADYYYGIPTLPRRSHHAHPAHHYYQQYHPGVPPPI